MTDKLHYFELTKITCPPGLLDDDTFERLKECTRMGKCEYWDGAAWKPIPSHHGVRRADVYVHRAVPLTMPVYPWAALHERLKWCAVDENGEAYAYIDKPTKRSYEWDSVGIIRIDGVFADYIPGTLDWRDGLQKRPEE